MYYLEYYTKLYHKAHIPFHYVLMIGYDDEEKNIFLYDCGRKEIIKFSYENLLLGMNAEYKGLCKPNTICTIRMERPNSKKDIFKSAMKIKTDMFLNPPTKFLGVNGLKKISKEMISWEEELGKQETDKILRSIVEFCGSVPTTPNRLNGISEKDEVVFMCSRDKMSKVLIELGREYNNNNLIKSGELFKDSGKQFEKLCNIFIDYILDTKKDMKLASDVILNIAEIEKNAYQLVSKGLNEI